MLDRDVAELLAGAGAILISEMAIIFPTMGGLSFQWRPNKHLPDFASFCRLPPTRRCCHDMAEAAEQLLAATNWLLRKIRANNSA
jgi:hypothetical protein